MVRSRVRKDSTWYVVEECPPGGKWVLVYEFPTWWQAMLIVTGELPYRAEAVWTKARRPLWVD